MDLAVKMHVLLMVLPVMSFEQLTLILRIAFSSLKHGRMGLNDW